MKRQNQKSDKIFRRFPPNQVLKLFDKEFLEIQNYSIMTIFFKKST